MPLEVDRYLLAVEHGHTYGYDEFIDRVMARLNYEDLDLETGYGHPATVDRSETVYRTKAVVALLSETMPGGEVADMQAQLPEGFADLFEFVGLETPPWEQD